jgi:hypothetical protein
VTIQDCFQAAVRIETLQRGLYLALARCFREEPPVAAAFRTLASRVEQHALRIRLVALHRAAAGGTDDTIERISRDVVKVLVELSAMAVNVRHDPDRASGSRVLRRVVDSDRRCRALHAAVLRRSEDPVVRALFAALSRKDDDQEQLLGRVLRATGKASVPFPAGRTAYAPSWPGGGSFAVAWRAREGRQGAAPWPST